MEQQKLAALTFDDGPTIGITDQVLDILEENDVKASFFLIGQQITEETEYLVKRAYDMGCSIENHSLTHASMLRRKLRRRSMKRHGGLRKLPERSRNSSGLPLSIMIRRCTMRLTFPSSVLTDARTGSRRCLPENA